MASNKEIAGYVVEQIEKLLDQPLSWSNGRKDFSFPHNPVSGTSYKGINVFSLAVDTLAHGYKSSRYMTYNQANKLGGQVRAGEKSRIIVFWKMLRTTDKDNHDKQKLIPLLRYYRVFNVDQIDGLPEKYQAPEFEDMETLQASEDLAASFFSREKVTLHEVNGTPSRS